MTSRHFNIMMLTKTVIKISPLSKLDTKQILSINQLIGQLFGRFDHSLTKTYLNSIIKNPNTKLFTAVQNKAIVGIVLMHIYTSLSRKVAIVDELVVNSRNKQQKVGHKLIGTAIKWARKNNVDCIECTTKTTNKPAINFFLKLGFYNRNQKALRLNLRKK